MERRRLIGLTLAAAVLAAVAVPTSLARAAAPACATSGLVLWLNTQGDGAAGSIYYHLELTNQSGHTCTLRGYPGVSAVDLGGHQLGSPGSRDSAHPAHLVTLHPGGTATAVLRVVEAGNFPATACHRVGAAGVRVYPPNQTASRTVPFPFEACSHTGPVILMVESVQA